MINFTLRALVCFAHIENQGNCDYKIATGGPSWFTSDYFNILARTEDPATLMEKRQMMQTALAQYFHLVLRREMRTANGYALEVAPHGLKLKPALKTDKCGEYMLSDKSDDHSLSRIFIAADCVSMDDIADVIQNMVFQNLPVMNRTGLPDKDSYQINLDVATARSASLSPEAGHLYSLSSPISLD